MSLEEVEASMRAQPKKASPAAASSQRALEDSRTSPSQADTREEGVPSQIPQAGPMQIMQPPYHQQVEVHTQAPFPTNLRQQGNDRLRAPTSHKATPPAHESISGQATALSNAQLSQQSGQRPPPVNESLTPHQPRQILQNPKRHSGQQSFQSVEPPRQSDQVPMTTLPTRDGGKVTLPIITHPSQIAALNAEQRDAFMAEEAKRAKRNHKIFILSKGNGLMTPQDKNFITRIQLQQLMTATGNVLDQESDHALSEDFYYQVYNQIENRPRQHPNQPLSNFAQTYLFRTGNRQGGLNRRHNRGENHMHRMQQQVQRAVEAAKAKPKSKQLVIEGSLGKISFSNAKTPKPLLNIKPNEKLPQASLNLTDRKVILKNIEAVYASLMAIEDHDRRIPQEPYSEQDPSTAEPFAQWRQTFKELSQKLWFNLRVMEPIIPNSTVMHPFIAFLSYPKGKKAIPRVFSHIDQEQRLTVLTIIMVQLDTLDVIRSAQPQVAAKQSPTAIREQIELFLQTVMPSLFSYVTEAPLSVIIGLVGLVLERVSISAVVHSRVGLETLTMLLSQAEIIRKAEARNEQEWQQWLSVYNRLFDTIEPLLTSVFPGPVSAGQDVYVWQFLATMGTGANPEQQQRLVLAVK